MPPKSPLACGLIIATRNYTFWDEFYFSAPKRPTNVPWHTILTDECGFNKYAPFSPSTLDLID